MTEERGLKIPYLRGRITFFHGINYLNTLPPVATFTDSTAAFKEAFVPRPHEAKATQLLAKSKRAEG